MSPDGNNGNDLRAKFAEDPEAADREVFGRKSFPDRRGFLKGAGLASMTAAVGMAGVTATDLTDLVTRLLADVGDAGERG